MRLLIQVIVFRQLIYIIKTLSAGNPLRWQIIWQLLLPKSWFAVLYAALYVLAPFINRMLHSLSDKSLKVLCGWPSWSAHCGPTVWIY